jgi:hypothetical protein
VCPRRASRPSFAASTIPAIDTITCSGTAISPRTGTDWAQWPVFWQVLLTAGPFLRRMTWSLPDSYHSSGRGRATATLKVPPKARASSAEGPTPVVDEWICGVADCPERLSSQPRPQGWLLPARALRDRGWLVPEVRVNMTAHDRTGLGYPADVHSCWLCGTRLATVHMVPDGGPACPDVRWYCQDARACTARWTASRARLRGMGRGRAGAAPAGAKQAAPDAAAPTPSEAQRRQEEAGSPGETTEPDLARSLELRSARRSGWFCVIACCRSRHGGCRLAAVGRAGTAGSGGRRSEAAGWSAACGDGRGPDPPTGRCGTRSGGRPSRSAGRDGRKRLAMTC